MASSEGTIFCGKHNAIIAARNEIDRRGLPVSSAVIAGTLEKDSP